MRRFVTAAVLVLLLGGAWLFRDRIRTAWYDMRGTAPADTRSPDELAARAESKLEALNDGRVSTASFSAPELEGVIVQRYGDMLPAFLDSPRVEVRGDQLRLRARVPIDKLPRLDELREVAAFLPDTTDLAIAGKLIPLDGGRVAFAVDEVTAARIPLPRRVVTGTLARLGRRDEPGLPADAVAVPLPPGVTAAYIRRDSLVLVGRPVEH